MQYNIPNITAEQIVLTAIGIYYFHQLTVEGIGKWLGLSEEYAKNAAQGAKELKIVSERTEAGNTLYIPVLPLCKYLAIAKVEERPVIFRQQLLEYDPFLFFKERLQVEDDPNTAAKQTQARYSISAEWNIIKERLSDWGAYAGILASSQGKLEIAQASTVSFLTWQSILDRAESTTHYVRERIGERAAEMMGTHNFNKLVTLLGEYEDGTKPAKELTICLVGIVDTIFTELTKKIKRGIDLSNCQGLTQLFQTMKSEGIIAKKHLGFGQMLGQLRIAVDHDVDHQEREAEWEIDMNTSRCALEIALSAIRSVVAYSKGQYIL